MTAKNSEGSKTGMWAFVEEHRKKLAEAFADVLTEKGLEWRKGWDADAAAPRNAVTEKPYRGLNRFNLTLISMLRGYTDPRWMTMTQIMDLKGTYHPGEKWHLQAGSKAVHVEYWYPFDTEEKKVMEWKDWNKLSSEERDSGRYSLRVKYTPVFHASMVDGISAWLPAPRQEQPLSEVVGKLSRSMGVDLRFDGINRAFYSPGEDKIHLPSPSSFYDEYEFNATALHELTHATGHPSRLARDLSGGFGSESYAYEELVAEIGSAFMGVALDIQQMPQHLENHKAYVQGWIDAIREKPETLAKAIGDAQNAAAYMDRKLEMDVEYRQQIETIHAYERDNHIPENERMTTWAPDQTVPTAKPWYKENDPSVMDRPPNERRIGITERMIADRYAEIKDSEWMVETNIGSIPVRDYREIKAEQFGFDSYKDLYNSGYRIGGGYDKRPESPQTDSAAIRQAAAQLSFAPASEMELGE